MKQEISQRTLLSALTIFLGGLGTGLALALNMADPDGSPCDPDAAGSQADIVKVRGLDADNSELTTPSPSFRGTGSSVLNPPLRATPREIAERSLEFTAFVRAGRSYGTGMLIDRSGHLLTCLHVIEGADRISITFSGETSLTARIVDVDRALDIALLKADGPINRAPAQRASIASVRAGDEVFAMGAPRKLRFSLSRGLVSYVGRPFSGHYYLQTDLPANRGSSGGPVMNDRGELLAMTSFVLKDSEGLAFAIPVEYAYERFTDILGAQTSAPDRSFPAWKQAMSTH